MSKNEIIRAIKGMNDVRPAPPDAFLNSARWQRIMTTCAQVLEQHGYGRIWLPAVEDTTLFARGIGEQTDIVSKEMYSFEDRGGRQLTLRPEGTAGAARAYVEHNLGRTEPQQKWWYFGPMFRAERPQKGRYRQFFQVGAELFGCEGPAADAEMIQMLYRMCQQLKLEDIEVRINSLGDDASREAYRETLRAYLNTHRSALDPHAQGLIATNPLRVLDSKHPSTQSVVADAPDILDALSNEARQHFEVLQKSLGVLNVPFVRDAKLVRGLDYYTGILFEFTTDALGAQNAVLGGGRYDGLVASLGGPPTPALGFAAGIERLALLGAGGPLGHSGPHLYLAPMAGSETQALALADNVRSMGHGWRVEVDLAGGRVKHQMRRADRCGARAALVLGDNEIRSGRAKLKNLERSTEHEVALEGSALAQALESLCS